MRYRYVSHLGHRYCWQTVADHNDDWLMWVDSGAATKITKRLTFKKRASAKRSAIRARDAHIRRNEKQKVRSKCNKCGEHVKIKGDYLCPVCRYG